MRKILIVLLCSGLSFLSCKKNEATPPAANAGTVTRTPPTNEYGYSGLFTSISSLDFPSGNQPHINKMITANFNSNPSGGSWNTPIRIRVNSVFLGSDSLQYEDFGFFYANYNSTAKSGDLWKVKGNNGIPSFSIKAPLTPVCDMFNILPDTVDKQIGFTITFKNVANITIASISISDDNMLSWGNITKNISSGTTSIYFSPEELKVIKPIKYCTLSFTMENTHSLILSGKWYKFSEIVSHFKYPTLKN